MSSSINLENLTSEESPVVMLNLIRFNEGGRAQYLEFMRKLTKDLLHQVGGEILYAGDGGAVLSGDIEAWDALVVARYPSEAAFKKLISLPGFNEVYALKLNSVSTAALQATRPWKDFPTTTNQTPL